jgi:hypothetical protein
MENLVRISGKTEAEIWQQVASDLAQKGDILEYSAQLVQGHTDIYLSIEIDLGGGFEGGFETTSFMAPLAETRPFKFHIHEQNLVNEIGKVFGLEDIESGYLEFDEAFIIKTNEPETLKALFAEENLRLTLLKHRDCELMLSPENHEADAPHLLTYTIDQAITEVSELQEIYHMLLALVQKLEQPLNENQL